MLKPPSLTWLVEDVAHHIWENVTGDRLPAFPTMRFADAMADYGVDKPDLRYDMRLKDVTSSLQRDGSSAAFVPLVPTRTGQAAPTVLAIRAQKAADLLTRKRAETLQAEAKGLTAPASVVREG